MKTTINMNDVVHVKLTERGKITLRSKLQEEITINGNEVNSHLLGNCEDFHLWELFYYFGEKICSSNRDVWFVDSEIEIL